MVANTAKPVLWRPSLLLPLACFFVSGRSAKSCKTNLILRDLTSSVLVSSEATISPVSGSTARCNLRQVQRPLPRCFWRRHSPASNTFRPVESITTFTGSVAVLTALATAGRRADAVRIMVAPILYTVASLWNPVAALLIELVGHAALGSRQAPLYLTLALARHLRPNYAPTSHPSRVTYATGRGVTVTDML